MALLTNARSGFLQRYTNQSGPSTTPGTSVTPGASGSEGSATVIATSGNITFNVYGIYLWITGGSSTGVSKMHLLDIGFDPAGGTSYTWVVNNLQVGMSGSAAQGGIDMYVPFFIPAGSQVAVRIQGSQATAGTVRVAAIFYGKPSHPETTQRMTKSETIGTVTSSRGVVVTPGASAAEGSWTSIAASTFRYRYVLPTMQIDDGTMTAHQIYFDIAYGDGTNFVIVAENINAAVVSTAEAVYVALASSQRDFWCDAPSGATWYIRASVSQATAESNYSFLVTGFA